VPTGRPGRLLLGPLLLILALGPLGARPTAGAVTQPAPPVTAAAFAQEPAGAAPADHDGLIPNPATPDGSPVGPPATCTVTFDAGAGATSATVNAWIAANQNALAGPTVVCLSGVFTSPLHVWSKTTPALLTLAPAPGSTATLDLGQATAADTDPNQYWGDTGGLSIVDSRSVEVEGLTIEGLTTDGTGLVPAGIYVTARSDTTATSQAVVPHLSACYLNHGSCGDIYLLDNTVTGITNQADQDSSLKSVCGNANVDAYGIAVVSAGSKAAEALQHVVVEGNTVSGTRTGQSETVTLNGELTDFLVADNTVHDVDNIGIDAIGWETGANQANHGLIQGNTVYDVDTLDNMSYGRWNGTACVPRPENAAGLYDDGGSYLWFQGNTVWNTDQGINLDVETAHKHTDHLLVSGNDVVDDPGTSAGDPSTGPEPPGVGGTSTVAGHDPYAFYVDAFGTGASITDVYAHDNVFQNQSQYYLQPSGGMPVVDVGGTWSHVQLWHNQIEGLGPADRDNPLVEIDHQPAAGTAVIDCNDYENLSDASGTVDGNFALPTADWLTLAQWQADNRHGWDADSTVGGFSPACPTATP
jgi:hypothetical protein